MPFTPDENIVSPIEDGLLDFEPLRDVQAGDYFLLQWVAYDDAGVALNDPAGWTKDTNSSVAISQLELQTWWKKVTSDDEVPTGVDQTTSCEVSIMVVRGLDATNPIDVSTATAAGTASTVTCESVVSTQDNQIALRTMVSDGQDFTSDPNIQTRGKGSDFKMMWEVVNTGATGTITATRAGSDQKASATVVLKRAAGDTSTPLQLAPISCLNEIAVVDNDDGFRDEIRDSGRTLDYDGAADNWTFDLANVLPGTDEIVLDSGTVPGVRIVYVSGAASVGISDGYYFTESGGGSTFQFITEVAGRYDSGSVVNITATGSGSGSIQDIGVLKQDYATTGSRGYGTGSSGTIGRATNITGNARSHATPLDVSGERVVGFYRPAAHFKLAYFLAVDSSGNWALWQISADTAQVDHTYIVDVASLDTPIRSYGTFDDTALAYHAILFKVNTDGNRFSLSATYHEYIFLEETIIGGNSTVPIEFYHIEKTLKWTTRLSGDAFNDYFQTFAPALNLVKNTLKLGDGVNPAAIEINNKALSMPESADGKTAVDYNVDGFVAGIELANISGNWRNSLIAGGSGFNFVSKSGDTVDYSGSIFILTALTLENARIYEGITVVNSPTVVLDNGASLEQSTVNESTATGTAGALQIDLADSPSLDNSAIKNSAGYGIRIEGVGGITLTDVTFAANATKDIYVAAVAGTVTITIDGGDIPTYDTAGATVVIVIPLVNYTLQLPNIIDGTRFLIRNVTTDTDLTNALVSGGIDETYVEGTDFTVGDVGEYRTAYQSGVTAKLELGGTFIFPSSTSTNTIPTAQEDDAVYNAYGQDGSTITGFSCDLPNQEIDIDIATGVSTVQDLACWYTYYKTTAIGITTTFQCLHWVKLNEVYIDQAVCDFHLENINAKEMYMNGGRIYRLDNTTVISPTSNSLQLDYDPVYAVQQLLIELIYKMLGNKKTLTKNDPNNYTEVILDTDGVTPLITRTHSKSDGVETRENV